MLNKLYLIKLLITLKRIKGASKISHDFDAKYPRLTSGEYEEVKNLWRVKLGNSNIPISQKGYRIYKTMEGFDASYCDEAFFPHYILRGLNLPVHVLGLEHKAMYDQVFSGLAKPKTIFKCVNGVLYDDNMNICSVEQCYELVKQYSAVCIKITTFSARGQGVKKIDVSDLTLLKFEDTVRTFGDNYIVQEIIKQSIKTAQLSFSSLNTFRVSSLFINGKCSICTIINRIGRGNSFIDNGLAGNYCIGVDESGDYRDYAYDKDYKRYYKTDTGIIYKGLVLDEIKELVKLVLESHPKYLPLCGFCGWDFALDENDQWNLIEVNLYAPGIELEQICPGKPLFGERTKEVIDWINVHQPSTMALLTSLAFV